MAKAGPEEARPAQTRRRRSVTWPELDHGELPPRNTKSRACPGQTRADGSASRPEPSRRRRTAAIAWPGVACPGQTRGRGDPRAGSPGPGTTWAGLGGRRGPRHLIDIPAPKVDEVHPIDVPIPSAPPRLRHPSPQKSMECTPSTSTGVASTSRFRRHPPFRRHPAPGLEYVLTCKDACPGPGLGMPKNRPVGPCPGQSSTTCTHAFDTPGPAEAQAFGDPLTRCNIGPRVRRGGDGGGAQV